MTVAQRARIVLLSGNSLSHNPRVLKAAGTLARAGHDVTVLGAWLDADLKAQDRRVLEHAPFHFVPVLDATQSSLRETMAQLLRRARRKAAHLVHRVAGRESLGQLGYAMAPLLAHARQIAADLYIAHSEPALYAVWQLLRRGQRVGVDMEDWFSEDLPPEVRRSRPLKLLRFLEAELLTRGAYASCPSRVMSEALAAAYGGKAPVTIYNAFPRAEWPERAGGWLDRRDPALRSICWYSQTLGPGRGIEDLIAALPLLNSEAELHLRGRAVYGMEAWIRSRLPDRWQQRVFIHPLVPNDELASRVAEHDIGFAGETRDCRSRDLTVTNKMLQYLLGGLAVVAGDTAGQRDVAVQAPGAVALYEPNNSRSLAEALDGLLQSPDKLGRAKQAALQAAQEIFCWEKQEPVLLDAMTSALGSEPHVSRRDRVQARSRARRRVLIVTGSYAPTMIADMHRARQLAWSLPKCGWDVEILCPDRSYQPASCNDSDSAGFFAPDVTVHQVAPTFTRLLDWLGVGSIGLRALAPLYFAGRKLLTERRFDLVYVSTAQVPLLLAAAAWRRRCGTPFVMDLHDPIFSGLAAGRGGIKERLSRQTAKFIERRVCAASGLVAVSPHYLELLQIEHSSRRPPCLEAGRFATMPFGILAEDLEQARRGHVQRREPTGMKRIVYVGTGGPIMARAFAYLCRALQALCSFRPQLIGNVRVELYGTASAIGGDGIPHLGRIAEAFGLTDVIGEYPARVSYRRSLELLLQGDGALVLGVDDQGYMPSKLMTYAASGKPLLACVHRKGPAFALLQERPALGHLLWFDDGADMPLSEAVAVLGRFVEEVEQGDLFARDAELAPYTAAMMAHRHAELFEACLV